VVGLEQIKRYKDSYMESNNTSLLFITAGFRAEVEAQSSVIQLLYLKY